MDKLIEKLKPYAEHAMAVVLVILAIIGAVLLAVTLGDRD